MENSRARCGTRTLSNEELTEVLRLSAEMRRLTAALHPTTTGKFTDVTFRVVSEWKLKQAGFSIRESSGNSQDNELNKSKKHFVVKITSAANAMKFAKALSERPRVDFSRSQVMLFFAISLEKKWLKADRVHKDVWKELIGDGCLKVLAEEASI